MKKRFLIFTFLFTLLVSAPLLAQDDEKRLSTEAEEFCKNLTRSMASQIMLNEEEVILLATINKEMILKTEEIKKSYANDAATSEKKLMEVNKLFQSRLKPILKPYQIQAFSNMKLTPNTWVVTSSKSAKDKTSATN